MTDMWHGDEIGWGAFGMARAEDGSDDIYLFATAEAFLGVKVARVAETSIADRSKYRFWSGSGWESTPPSQNDALSNILSYSTNKGVNTGVSLTILDEVNN